MYLLYLFTQLFSLCLQLSLQHLNVLVFCHQPVGQIWSSLAGNKGLAGGLHEDMLAELTEPEVLEAGQRNGSNLPCFPSVSAAPFLPAGQPAAVPVPLKQKTASAKSSK